MPDGEQVKEASTHTSTHKSTHTEDNSYLACAKCHEVILSADKLCFYNNYSQGIHLSIKFEEQDSFLSDPQCTVTLAPQSDAKRKRISSHEATCNVCYSIVGSLNATGPKRENICCFSSKTCILQKGRDNFTGSWSTVKPFLKMIQERNPSTYYGTPEEYNPQNLPTIPVRLPSIRDIANCNLRELTIETPRPYQIEEFVMAAQRNSIVYLPTGAGKTLIAAMLISFMHKLNPSKKIYFVVDRVPLTFQQGQYLSKQTNLNILIACGIKY